MKDIYQGICRRRMYPTDSLIGQSILGIELADDVGDIRDDIPEDSGG